MAEILENNIELMEQLAKGYQVCDSTAIQNSLPEAYQEQAKLKQTVYREEGKWCKASCGIMVRSRVEAMIADLYTAKGITFEYEPELILSDYTVIHPDFKVYVPSEERYKYHEHVGLLSDPEYRASFIRKLDLYLSNGLYPFHDVIFTYEKPDRCLDMALISSIIDLFLR